MQFKYHLCLLAAETLGKFLITSVSSPENRKNNLIGSVRMKSDIYEAFISVPGIQSVLEMSAAFAMNLAS